MHCAKPYPLIHRDLKPPISALFHTMIRILQIVILDYVQTIQIQPHIPEEERQGLLGIKRRKCKAKFMAHPRHLVLRNNWPQNVCPGMAALIERAKSVTYSYSSKLKLEMLI
jgi:hypothetical protein